MYFIKTINGKYLPIILTCIFTFFLNILKRTVLLVFLELIEYIGYYFLRQVCFFYTKTIIYSNLFIKDI